MESDQIKSQLDSFKAQLDVQAEKISLLSNIDSPNKSQNIFDVSQNRNNLTPLPESIKLDPSLGENVFENTKHDIKLENILPETLKMDISMDSNMNVLEPSLKQDVSSISQNKLEESIKYNYVETNENVPQVKFETIEENPNFQNTLIEVPKKETNMGPIITPSATNAFEVNTLKFSMNSLASNVGSALKDLETRVNEPAKSDQFEERITINPSNLIFEDRKTEAFQKPKWA